MNRVGILFAWLWPLLWLAAGPARAETPVWFDNFETNAASHWSLGGAWRISAPTAGPTLRTYSGSHCANTQNYGTDEDSRLICVNYNGQTFLTVPSADQYPRLRFWHWFSLANAIGFVEISTNGTDWNQISPTYSYAGTPSSAVWSRPDFDLSAYAGQNIQIAFHFYGGPSGNGLGWYVDDVGVFTGAPVLNFPESFEQGQGDWSVTMGTWQVGKPTSGPGAAHTGTNCAATVLAGNFPNYANSQLVSPPFQVPANSPQLRFWQWYSLGSDALFFVEVNNGFTSTTSVTNVTVTTNSAGAFNTNIYYFSGAQLPGYTDTNFYWNPVIGAWTNSQNKALGNVFDGNYEGSGISGYYFEAGNAPFSLIGNGQVDYVATVRPIPESANPTNFLQWNGMTWDSALGNGLDTPVGYFAASTNTAYVTNITVTTTTASWTQISPTYQNGTSGGWQPVSVDLGAFTNQTVQLAFHFGSGGLATAPGWYVDDINLVAAPNLIVPTNQVIYAGQELIVTNYAANTYLPNATYTFKLLSGPTNASITPQGGVLTWQTSSNQPSSTNTFIVQATDNSGPQFTSYVVTNSFLVTVINQGIPVLTVPPTQMIFAGQTLTVTNYGTNVYSPDDTFSFALLSGLTNSAAGLLLNPTDDGVFTWNTLTNLAAKSYTNKVVLTDESSGLTATNGFVVVVSNPPPPTLLAPANQMIYVGQPLTVTNTASSVYDPVSVYTFRLLAGPTNSVGFSALTLGDGFILNWTSLPVGKYTNKVAVLESVSQRNATNSFTITVSNAPPPALAVPPAQKIYAGQTLTVTNTATSVYGTNSTFTFALLSTLTNSAAGLTELEVTNPFVLTWQTRTNLTAGTYTNKVTVTDSVSLLIASTNFTITVSNPPPPTLIVPPTQKIYAGQTLTVTNTATSVYGTNSTFTFALLSGLSLPAAGLNVSGLTNYGVLTWATKTNLTAGSYTNKVTVLDNFTELSATNSFVLTIVTNTPPPPTLAVPPNQVIYAGQTLTVTNIAASVFGTNDTFTYSLLSSLTNPPAGLNELNFTNLGILVWATKTSLAPATYTNLVTAFDGFSGLGVSNSFLVQVLPPQPPVLTVPPTLLIYAGQLLTVTNTATGVYPGDTFTFAAVGPTNLDTSSLPQTGVLRWTPTASQAPGENYIFVQVTDSELLSTLTNFLVLVAMPPSPQLSAAPGPKTSANAIQFTLTAPPNSTWTIEAATNLTAPATNWFPVFTNLTGPSGTMSFTDTLATNFPQRYYRAVFR
jgi:hypothetical protein